MWPRTCEGPVLPSLARMHLRSILKMPHSRRWWLRFGRTMTTVAPGIWETRVPEHLPVNSNLVRWSCSSATYDAILRYTETIQDAGEATWVESLFERFVVGGVSALVRELRSFQEVTA